MASQTIGRNAALFRMVFDFPEDLVASVMLQEAGFYIDDFVKRTRHMESKGKTEVRFLGIGFMGKKPPAVGKGKFHLISVMKTVFRGNDVMNEDLG
jgi:hypothetical protein